MRASTMVCLVSTAALCGVLANNVSARGFGGLYAGLGSVRYSQQAGDNYNATGPYTGGAAQLDSYNQVNWNSQPDYGSSYSRAGSAGPLTDTGYQPRPYTPSGGYGDSGTSGLGDQTYRIPGYDSGDTTYNYGSIQHYDAQPQFPALAAAGAAPPPQVRLGTRGAVAPSPIASPAAKASHADDGLAGYRGPYGAKPLAALPPGYTATVWKGGAYYHSGLSFYRPYWCGGEIRYWPVYPPAGWSFASLPAGAAPCVVDGVTYYCDGGVWLQANTQGAQHGYTVIEDPSQGDLPPGISGGTTTPDPFQVLRRMSDYLAGQQHFTMSIAETVDKVSPTGQKIQIASQRTFCVQRPDKVAIDIQRNGKTRRLVYDAGTFTLIDAATNTYGTISLPGTLDAALDQLAKQYGTALPASDLLYTDIFERLARKSPIGQYLGSELLAGRRCDHLAFSQEGIGWQIWIESGPTPIPRKIIIRYDNSSARPQYVLLIDAWSTDSIPSTRFEANPPPGAVRIDVQAVAGRATAGRVNWEATSQEQAAAPRSCANELARNKYACR